MVDDDVGRGEPLASNADGVSLPSAGDPNDAGCAGVNDDAEVAKVAKAVDANAGVAEEMKSDASGA